MGRATHTPWEKRLNGSQRCVSSRPSQEVGDSQMVFAGMAQDCVMCQGDIGRFGRNVGGGKETCCGACEKFLQAAREKTKRYFDAHFNNATTGECEVCGGATKVASSSGRPFRYCSDTCKGKARRITSVDLERSCAICEKAFTTKISNQKFCSAECRGESRARSLRVGRVGDTNRRRCKKFGGNYEHLDPKKVFERDMGICQICMSPVDDNAVFPDPLVATLDHIVPLSRGGNHEMSNIRLTHWSCNRKKWDKLDEEM